MKKQRKSALKVLGDAADVYNCWAILDDAIEGDDHDMFSRQMIEGEREMLADAIADLQQALKKLGKRYGIQVNASCVDMRPWEASK